MNPRSCYHCGALVRPGTTHFPNRQYLADTVCEVVDKPHLRLECVPTPAHPTAPLHWRVVYVRGPSQRVRKTSFWSPDVSSAVYSAIYLWFPRRYWR